MCVIWRRGDPTACFERGIGLDEMFLQELSPLCHHLPCLRDVGGVLSADAEHLLKVVEIRSQARAM